MRSACGALFKPLALTRLPARPRFLVRPQLLTGTQAHPRSTAISPGHPFPWRLPYQAWLRETPWAEALNRRPIIKPSGETSGRRFFASERIDIRGDEVEEGGWHDAQPAWANPPPISGPGSGLGCRLSRHQTGHRRDQRVRTAG